MANSWVGEPLSVRVKCAFEIHAHVDPNCPPPAACSDPFKLHPEESELLQLPLPEDYAT